MHAIRLAPGLLLPLIGLAAPLSALDYTVGSWWVDHYSRSGSHATTVHVPGTTYQMIRSPREQTGVGRLVAGQTIDIPSAGRYALVTNIKNGASFVTVNGVRGGDAQESGSGPNDMKYATMAFPGSYAAGDRLQVSFHATFESDSDWALAKVELKRTGDPVVVPGTGDLPTIAERLRAPLLASTVAAPAVLADWVRRLGSDGRWSDISYAAATSPSAAYAPLAHLTRLRSLAIAYERGDALGVDRATVLGALSRAVRQSVANRSLPSTFIWDDWYNIYIACPWNLLESLLLVADDLPADVATQAIGYLRDELTMPSRDRSRPYQFMGSGQNVVWVAANTVRLGVLRRDAAMVAKGYDTMSRTMVINAPGEKEGLMADGSFHQHEMQIYNGGYGLWYVGSIVQALEQTRGTAFAVPFTTERLGVFGDNLLRGHRWMGFRAIMDFGARGRNIARPEQDGGVSSDLLQRLAVVDPARAPAYDAWRGHVAGGAFPEPGNRHFWQSDFMVHRGADWYLSAKVISTRTTGTESMNDENRKGRNLPLGATNFVLHGEEYRGIYPAWDWSRIPGVTARLGIEQPAGHTFTGTNAYAGGVSDGRNGILAFQSDYDGVTARKAYFFFGDRLLCLGSGITGAVDGVIATTVNQCRERGPVELGRWDGRRITNPNGASTARWVWHDGFGYVFPGGSGQPVVLQRQVQRGTWNAINGLQSNTVPVEVPMFGLRLDHGNRPANRSYAYIVVPRASQAGMPSVASSPLNPVVRSNTSQVQMATVGSVAGIVLHQAGSVTVQGHRVVSDRPVVALIDWSNGPARISVADPMGSAVVITLTVDGQQVAVPMGQGNDRGRTVTMTLPQRAPNAAG